MTSPKIPALKFIREVARWTWAFCPDPRGASRRGREARGLPGVGRLSGGRHPAGRLALIALALGLSGLAAAHELRTPTESVMANPAPSSADGPAFASSSGGGSGKLWNVADAISAAGVSSTLPLTVAPGPGRLGLRLCGVRGLGPGDFS